MLMTPNKKIKNVQLKLTVNIEYLHNNHNSDED